MKNSRRQTGLTLLELLIALGLGVFLIAGILQVFFGSRQSSEVIRAQSTMQEAGRFGADFIAKTLRHAGYINAGVIDTDFAQAVVNIHDTGYSAHWPLQNGFQQSAVINGTDGAVDSFTVRLQGDPDAGMVDCEGRELTTSDAEIVRIAFSVDTANQQLNCQVFDGAAQRPTVALVNGIEDMQILYGVATDPNAPHLVGKYVSAGDVAVEEWQNIVAVRVGLLAVSENTPLSDASTDYTLLDKQIEAVADGRARQVFTQTVALRNKLSG